MGNGFGGGGVFGFTLAGNCLSVLYGLASKVGCGALMVLNEPPRILSLASFAFFRGFLQIGWNYAAVFRKYLDC